MGDEQHDTAPLLLDDGTDLDAKTASLIVMSGSSIGQMFTVDEPESIIGRADDAEIKLSDEGISRKHAKVIRGDTGDMTIVDLGSRNGTFVNMKRVDSRQLKDGDKIQLGAVTILKFTLQSAMEERFQRKLYDSATRDTLTTAYNRRFFDEQLAKDFSHARRHRTPLSLLVLDVDHFKRVNDTHGHLVGDVALKWLGKLVAESIRLEDVFCRIGGEEFAVIMRDASADHARRFGERLRGLVEATPFVCEQVELALTVSVGAASLDPESDPTPAALVEHADQALYRAKNDGRNRVCVGNDPG